MNQFNERLNSLRGKIDTWVLENDMEMVQLIKDSFTTCYDRIDLIEKKINEQSANVQICLFNVRNINCSLSILSSKQYIETRIDENDLHNRELQIDNTNPTKNDDNDKTCTHSSILKGINFVNNNFIRNDSSLINDSAFVKKLFLNLSSQGTININSKDSLVRSKLPLSLNDSDFWRKDSVVLQNTPLNSSNNPPQITTLNGNMKEDGRTFKDLLKSKSEILEYSKKEESSKNLAEAFGLQIETKEIDVTLHKDIKNNKNKNLDILFGSSDEDDTLFVSNNFNESIPGNPLKFAKVSPDITSEKSVDDVNNSSKLEFSKKLLKISSDELFDSNVNHSSTMKDGVEPINRRNPTNKKQNSLKNFQVTNQDPFKPTVITTKNNHETVKENNKNMSEHIQSKKSSLFDFDDDDDNDDWLFNGPTKTSATPSTTITTPIYNNSNSNEQNQLYTIFESKNTKEKNPVEVQQKKIHSLFDEEEDDDFDFLNIISHKTHASLTDKNFESNKEKISNQSPISDKKSINKIIKINVNDNKNENVVFDLKMEKEVFLSKDDISSLLSSKSNKNESNFNNSNEDIVDLPKDTNSSNVSNITQSKFDIPIINDSINSNHNQNSSPRPKPRTKRTQIPKRGIEEPSDKTVNTESCLGTSKIVFDYTDKIKTENSNQDQSIDVLEDMNQKLSPVDDYNKEKIQESIIANPIADKNKSSSSNNNLFKSLFGQSDEEDDDFLSKIISSKNI